MLTGQVFKTIKGSCMANRRTSVSSIRLKTEKLLERVNKSLLSMLRSLREWLTLIPYTASPLEGKTFWQLIHHIWQTHSYTLFKKEDIFLSCSLSIKPSSLHWIFAFKGALLEISNKFVIARQIPWLHVFFPRFSVNVNQMWSQQRDILWCTRCDFCITFPLAKYS